MTILFTNLRRFRGLPLLNIALTNKGVFVGFKWIRLQILIASGGIDDVLSKHVQFGIGELKHMMEHGEITHR